MAKVVITGLGTINALGKNVAETWENLKQEKCGISPISSYDTQERKVTLAAEVKDFQAEAYFDKKEARHLDRYLQFALIAAKEALLDAQYEPLKNPYRAGVIVSSGIGGLGTIEAEDRRVMGKNAFDKVTPYFIPMVISNMAAAHVAKLFQAKGMCSSIATACASSTNAIGEGFLAIKSGRYDLMVVGGSEATITPLGIGGFTSLKALSTATDPQRASIPFDVERNGFVMGEGAAMLVLESEAHAKARGAKIYAELVGYGSTCDAYHITAPDPSAEPAICAMEMALEEAGISPQEIDYINAHGTSTKLNDETECTAYRKLFSEQGAQPMLSSTKASTGHLLGATGALETLLTTLMITHEFIPKQIHLRELDAACSLEIATGNQKAIHYALTNNLGFGGHNASLILKRRD